MQVPVQIDFQGCEPIARLREHIEQGFEQLEKLYGRITAGRAVVKAPGAHHRSGGLYEVGVHLSMPGGRNVDVERTPTPDERFGDPLFAIGDAFRRARRQLQDQSRRMDRRIKHHEAAPTAKVARMDPSGEFGFLQASDGSELYFHRNSVLNGGFAKLTVESRVAYAEEPGNEGPQASTVRLLGKQREVA